MPNAWTDFTLSTGSMIEILVVLLLIAYLASIPILLLAILYAVKAGFNEVIRGLQTIADQGDIDRKVGM
jgi:hypothetical protein